MVIVNNNPSDQILNLDRFKEGIAGKKRGYEISTANSFTLDRTIEVPASTTFIIELN